MFKTLDDASVSGKIVLLRGDLNVPMADGKVTDKTRIERLMPTVRELCEKGARVVILSHFGRPKGQRVPEMSLAPIAPAVAEVLGAPVAFADDCVGSVASDAIAKLDDGQVLLLENLRYHPEEEKNDPMFAAKLGQLGDLYVNDAFSAAHRAHASTHGVAKTLPAYAGRNMQAELEALEAALGNPEKPVAAIVGGAKVSTKLAVLTHLIEKVDVLVIGGGMANTFLHALGTDIGASLCEKDLAETAREIMAKADQANCEVILPSDVVVAKEFKAGAENEVRQIASVQKDGMILDIGPDSATALAQRLETCKTLLWNGPMGAFEIEPFDAGTVKVAQAAGKLTANGNLVSIAGGGDTVAALAHAGVSDKFTYISTAGGAFLEWMEGKELPGVAVLEK
ncbi:phosphoglycerate kinase [Aestuariispira insulae]|uniref:Phosphoglycerate kinase n=1 Tax=Aestuariispira insulae TaxID=1461337 RepID=A0A3D9HF80_9PROT|nr:phosphoglycerate kinase [Aestuariispira insulae]RED48139.1 phosphoglycerate kinase [Aestuariispira insulae]